MPELNKKAKITFYDVNLINPIILKDGFPCTSNECKLISKDNNSIEFEVEHFTTYSVGSLNDYICRNGYSGTPCFCGPDIISENYCCKGVIKVDSCEDDYFSSEPPVVFNCSKDLEGECVIIGNMTGTCIDGNLEEGCISKQVSSWDGINKLINENLSVFFIILGLFGLFIILLILNKVLFLNKEKKKELTKTKYQKSENMVIQDILSNVDQKDKKFTKDELLEQLRSDLKSNKK